MPSAGLSSMPTNWSGGRVGGASKSEGLGCSGPWLHLKSVACLVACSNLARFHVWSQNCALKYTLCEPPTQAQPLLAPAGRTRSAAPPPPAGAAGGTAAGCRLHGRGRGSNVWNNVCGTTCVVGRHLQHPCKQSHAARRSSLRRRPHVQPSPACCSRALQYPTYGPSATNPTTTPTPSTHLASPARQSWPDCRPCGWERAAAAGL